MDQQISRRLQPLFPYHIKSVSVPKLWTNGGHSLKETGPYSGCGSIDIGKPSPFCHRSWGRRCNRGADPRGLEDHRRAEIWLSAEAKSHAVLDSFPRMASEDHLYRSGNTVASIQIALLPSAKRRCAYKDLEASGG